MMKYVLIPHSLKEEGRVRVRVMVRVRVRVKHKGGRETETGRDRVIQKDRELE